MQSRSASSGLLNQPTDPLLIELGYLEMQQDNARLRQIIAELLVKNQELRWALEGKDTPDTTDLRWLAAVEAA